MDPMSKPLRDLAAGLLEMAAEQFGRHGCNDCDLAERLPEGDAARLARTYDIFNLGSAARADADPGQAHTPEQMRRATDFILMRACALLLRSETEAGDPAAVIAERERCAEIVRAEVPADDASMGRGPAARAFDRIQTAILSGE